MYRYIDTISGRSQRPTTRGSIPRRGPTSRGPSPRRTPGETTTPTSSHPTRTPRSSVTGRHTADATWSPGRNPKRATPSTPTDRCLPSPTKW